MVVPRMGFHIPADLVTVLARQKGIGQNYVGIDIGQPEQRRFPIGDADHFKTFFPQDTLAHALGMRAVVGQQNPAERFTHLLTLEVVSEADVVPDDAAAAAAACCCCSFSFFLFFFAFFFFAGGIGWLVTGG